MSELKYLGDLAKLADLLTSLSDKDRETLLRHIAIHDRAVASIVTIATAKPSTTTAAAQKAFQEIGALIAAYAKQAKDRHAGDRQARFYQDLVAVFHRAHTEAFHRFLAENGIEAEISEGTKAH